MEYAIFKACERFQILPPDIKPSWDDNDVWAQARIIAYNQVRDLEDSEEKAAMWGVKK